MVFWQLGLVPLAATAPAAGAPSPDCVEAEVADLLGGGGRGATPGPRRRQPLSWGDARLMAASSFSQVGGGGRGGWAASLR